MDSAQLPIIDCHLHFFDARVHRYPIFQQRSVGFETLVGDYSALPRRYYPEDYFKDVKGFHVTRTVCAEFMSDSCLEEVRWLQGLSTQGGQPSGTIALADFTSPDIERLLEEYASLGRVHAVRQHLGWHPSNPLLRFAPAPDLLSDANWRRGVASLRKHGLCCEIEIFAHQLPGLAALARSFPDQQFVFPLMGWPLDVTEAGYQAWKRDMTALSACQNVAVKIFGMECIFGQGWNLRQVRPWILDVIALFGPARCMFASHMPITLLVCSFQDLYRAYLEAVSDFGASEKRQLFHDTAAVVYGL
ncbi:MAG: amidohydrolase family protein [Acidobacteriaceae bacterium]|nr:amidohydrolase family protein [Acidobacteriaceae bacterium]MBV9497754.1 amidohydrolase family protein [Acidobacteriaceae bacterium]